MSRTITIELTDEEVEFIERNWEPLRDDHPIFAARKKIYEALTAGEGAPLYKVANFLCDREGVTVTLVGPFGERVDRRWGRVGSLWAWRQPGNGGWSSDSEAPYIEEAVANHDFLSTWFLKENAAYYGRGA